ncbi:hypothetical protein I6E29_00370 [Arcanobacterium haemolyticum]|nr:hypothetical protein [Arcanobacterium haemolyticum]
MESTNTTHEPNIEPSHTCGCGGACGGHGDRTNSPAAQAAKAAGHADLSDGRINLGLKAAR